MEKDGLIDSIRDNLDERRASETHKQTDAMDRKLIQNFKKVEAAKDVGLTLDAFGALLQDTQKYHVNDPDIEKSVNNALLEWEGAKRRTL